MTDARGEDADRPLDIPRAGWKAILLRVWTDIGRDHVSLIAAGVAFYGLLALFPAITALVAIGGLMFEPSDIASRLEGLASLLPEGAAEIITTQAMEVAGSRGGGLGLTALLGIGLALYSASKGIASLIEGINVAYDEEETRGFFHRTALTLGLTVFLTVGMAAGLGATIVLPGILSIIDLGATTEFLIGLARWVVLLLMTIGGIAILYRFAPDRSAPKWRWITPGAVIACVLWIIASIAFSIYAESFANYNESFGTLGGAIALLMWLWISAFVLLLGAEINAEAEHQTSHDTTVGQDMPIGRRGAVKADTPPPQPTESG